MTRVVEVMAWAPEIPGWYLGGDRDELSWQDAALCAQTDPEAFFPDRGESNAAAKKVCRECPVRAECLEYAVEHGIRDGIWGGLSERQRRPLLAARWPGAERCAAGRHPLAGDNLLPGGKCRACREVALKGAETQRIAKGLAA